MKSRAGDQSPDRIVFQQDIDEVSLHHTQAPMLL